MTIATPGASLAVTPKRGAPPADSVGAILASGAVCVALATDIETLSATASKPVPPASSAALAAATLAAARGDALTAATSVFGGLLPDGSVAGVPSVADLEAARGAAITRLGIPAGTRSAYDPRRKKRVDLVEAGARLGVEVVEVTDLAAAYALMTGAELPRPRPVESEAMELEGAIERRLETAYQSWRQRLAPEWSRVLERGEAGLGRRARRLVARLQREVAGAEKERASGQVASGLLRLRRAYAGSREVSRLAARGPGLDEAARRAEREVLAGAVDKAFEGIRSDGFGTAGETAGRAVRAAALWEARTLAAAEVAGPDYFAREARARMLLAAAADAVELEGSWGPAQPIEASRATAIAAGHRRAAAGLGRPGGAELGEPRAGDPLIALATARRAHLDAWIALARRDLLGLERHPEDGAVTGARNPKALARLVELADQAARRAARAAAVATGSVPVTARVLYQAARSLRGGTAAEVTEALELYWRSGWLSELVVIGARR